MISVDTDSSSSVQGKAVEVTNSKRAVPKESSTASSSSLQVQSVQKPSANAQQSDLPLQVKVGLKQTMFD